MYKITWNTTESEEVGDLSLQKGFPLFGVPDVPQLPEADDIIQDEQPGVGDLLPVLLNVEPDLGQ